MTKVTVAGQGEVGSFHYAVANEFFGDMGMGVDYVPFESHELLLHNLFDSKNEIHKAVIAVDNNTSGRVISAIDALRQHPEVRIIGSVVANIDQHLLLAPGHSEEDLQAVISQQPALDQCEGNIQKAGLMAVPYYDTAAAARRVRDSNGRYHDFTSVAAIGPQAAGKLHGLTVGSRFNDAESNATKFWIVSDAEEPSHGTHTALTFEVPDRAGALFTAIGIISVKYGYNLTDIDSHLAPESEDRRAFFAEIEHGDSDLLQPVLDELDDKEFKPQVLGHYTPKGRPLEVEDGNHHVPAALKHDEWSGRHGMEYPEGSTTLYVETTHEAGALHKVLGCLAAYNLVDLGRPIVPRDHKFNRGFYIVIDPNTRDSDTQTAVKNIRSLGYKAGPVQRESKVA